jgi:hypothetical protein
MSDLAKGLIKEFEDLKGTRVNWDSLWDEVAERVMPRQANFLRSRTQGEDRTERIFDSTAVLANERFASIMESMLTPRTQKWHRLTSTDESLNKSGRVREWFDEANAILYKKRYMPYTNYASQQSETYMSLGAFGTGALFVDNVPGKGLRYKSVHLSEIYVRADSYGVIDTVFRHFELTKTQAVQRWGDAVPKRVMDEKSETKKFKFLHIVKPRIGRDPTRVDFKGMPFESWYVNVDFAEVISESGYNTFPYAISRYVVAPDELYGRSPAIGAFSDIKMVNEMSRSQIRIAHKLADPPLLLHDDGILGYGNRTVNLTPGGLNYGGVSPEGRQLIHPLQTGGDLRTAEAILEQRRKAINDAFLTTLFQILVETPEMTATEAMIRAQEKGQLLGPTISRQQSEALGPMIERELDVLMRNGDLPEMPPELLEAEGEYDVVYDNPMTRMMQAEEVVGLQRTIETIAPFVQVNPDLMAKFDAEQIAEDTAYINGVPSKWVRGEEEMEALQQQQAQADQQAQAVETMPAAATAMRDLAQAQALMGGE